MREQINFQSKNLDYLSISFLQNAILCVHIENDGTESILNINKTSGQFSACDKI